VVGLVCTPETDHPSEDSLAHGLDPLGCPHRSVASRVDAAAWDPTDNAWRALPAPPLAHYERSANGGHDATFLNGRFDELLAVSWDRTTQTWVETTNPPGPPIDGEQVEVGGVLACSGSGGTRAVAALEDPPDTAEPRPRQAWITFLDSDTAAWSERLDMGYTGSSLVACHDDLAVVRSMATDKVGLERYEELGVDNETQAVTVIDAYRAIDLRSGETSPVEVGPNLGVEVIGDGEWMVVDRVADADLAAMGTASGPSDPASVSEPAPTTRFVGQLHRDGRGEPAPVRFAEVDAASSPLGAIDGYPPQGLWSEGLWFGASSMGRGANEDYALRFVAWVPPGDG
ncbi:MAG: hypothetical protein ACK5O2_11400, partial [Microthrixaceae bacterium]